MLFSVRVLHATDLHKEMCAHIYDVRSAAFITREIVCHMSNCTVLPRVHLSKVSVALSYTKQDTRVTRFRFLNWTVVEYWSYY